VIAIACALVALAAVLIPAYRLARRVCAPARGRHTAAYLASRVPAPAPARVHVPLVLTGRVGRHALTGVL
jgi:hypothetical protein